MFLTAGVDGSGIPLPGAVDAVIVAYVYQHPMNAWLYVMLASAGSAVGCVVLYWIGYLGGEVLIERRMSPAKFEKIRRDFEDHPILTLGLPAVLPPPFPFKIVVLSAGAFEMRLPQFVAVLFAARLVRFGLLSALTVVFGPGIITLFNNGFRRHPGIVVAAIAVIAGGVWLARRLRRAEVAVEVGAEADPA